MTGTSIDGDLDAAIIAVHGHGLDMHAPLVHGQSFSLGALTDDLRRAASGAAMTAREFTRLSHAFGLLHAEAIELLCEAASVRPDLVVLHGQTVVHAPPLSWQLVNPWPVAVRLGCPVRYDLRASNLGSGGQGAPITPLADFILYGEDARAKTILNLGGFANATLLPARGEGPDAIRGLDLCPCNHLLDRVARTRLGRAFDEDGRAARQGRPDEPIAAAIAEMAMEPLRALAAHGHRSLGSGDEAAQAIERTDDLSPEDACATVVEAVARMLAEKERKRLLRKRAKELEAAAAIPKRKKQRTLNPAPEGAAQGPPAPGPLRLSRRHKGRAAGPRSPLEPRLAR
jgi:1,6-anhydro-N-acetylmuramate kinase